MGWTRLGTFATLVAAFASAAPAAAAPSQSETVRGILLQADIARIVERRKADDREVQQIRSYEQRIAGFRREVAQWRETASQRQRLTQGERRARELVERSLSEARGELSRAVEQLAKSDAEWTVEREAYRRELRQTVAKATPQQLAALALFAEGKRTEAWPILSTLAAAQARALVAAAQLKAAAVFRDLAEQREVMRINDEASATDVLTIWEQAAALDPEDIPTQLEISGLAVETREFAKARTAAELAVALAEDADDKIKAYGYLSEAHQAAGDITNAVEVERQAALLYFDKLNKRNLSPRDAQRFSLRLRIMAGLKRDLRDPAGAIAALQAAVTLDRALAAQAPRDTDRHNRVVSTLGALARIQSKVGDLPGERATLEEAVASLRELKKWESASFFEDLASTTLEGPTITQVASADLARMLDRLAASWLRAGNPERATPLLEEAVALFREAAPSARRDLASTLLTLAQAGRRSGRFDRAISAAREAEGIYGALRAEQPGDTESQVDHALAVSFLADALEFGGRKADALAKWRNAATLWQDLVARLPDGTSYQEVLDEARAHRDALLAAEGGQ